MKPSKDRPRNLRLALLLLALIGGIVLASVAVVLTKN